MSQVYLNQFKIIKPKNEVRQEVLLDWITRCHQTAEAKTNTLANDKMKPELLKKLFSRYSVKPAQISKRYFESNDILSQDFSQNEIYKIDHAHNNGVDILKRSQFFLERAREVFEKIYDLTTTDAKRPDHLIHVTCTGYISPSAPQIVIGHKNWNYSTALTHAYHMGCYASMPAVRLAKSLVISESAKNYNFTTDIVHNEMCGLHMNAQSHEAEQIVVQTLFADGHVKYTASAEKGSQSQNFKVLEIHEKIVTSSQQDMSWIPASWGMQMSLSRDVPDKIKTELKAFTNNLLDKAKIKISAEEKIIFAIHPGGPKIIDAIQEVLSLNEDQISESRKVLFERGNMSSATLPHVWNEILNNQYPTGTKVISYAFGPGLTLFGALFEVC